MNNNELNVIIIASKLPQSNKIGKANIIDSYIVDDKLSSKWDINCSLHLDNVKYLAKKHTKEIFLFCFNTVHFFQL